LKFWFFCKWPAEWSAPLNNCTLKVSNGKWGEQHLLMMGGSFPYGKVSW
jgi:hypothetical protein